MLSPMGPVRSWAAPLALWRQRLGPDLNDEWRGVMRHLKGSPRRNRYLFWAVCVWLLALHLTHLMAKSDDAPIVWGPPIEPPGAVIVTASRTDLVQDSLTRQDRAEASGALQSVVADVTDVDPEANTQTVLGEALPDELHASLSQWSDAWRRQDVATYLDMYAPEFVPSNCVSRQAWAQSRTRRILGKSSIRHEVHDLNVQMGAASAVVTFTQIYQDERIRQIDQKTMHWVHRHGHWLIALEKTQ